MGLINKHLLSTNRVLCSKYIPFPVGLESTILAPSSHLCPDFEKSNLSKQLKGHSNICELQREIVLHLKCPFRWLEFLNIPLSSKVQRTVRFWGADNPDKVKNINTQR